MMRRASTHTAWFLFVNRGTHDHGQVDEGVCGPAPAVPAGQRHHRQDQLRPPEEVRPHRQGGGALPRALRRTRQPVQMKPLRCTTVVCTVLSPVLLACRDQICGLTWGGVRFRVPHMRNLRDPLALRVYIIDQIFMIINLF